MAAVVANVAAASAAAISLRNVPPWSLRVSADRGRRLSGSAKSCRMCRVRSRRRLPPEVEMAVFGYLLAALAIGVGVGVAVARRRPETGGSGVVEARLEAQSAERRPLADGAGQHAPHPQQPPPRPRGDPPSPRATAG